MRSNLGIIIGREFYERVRKKSFIISTILMPLLMVAIMTVPAVLMILTDGNDTKSVVVIDNSGVVGSKLHIDEALVFIPTDLELSQARDSMMNHFGILVIGENIVDEPTNMQLHLSGSSSMSVESRIENRVTDVIREIRLARYEANNIDSIVRDANVKASFQSFKIEADAAQSSKAVSSKASAGVGYALGFILYILLIAYGTMVMQSIVEEKSSRVLEVLVCSVRPFELMAGKIIGVASVAVTQLLIWGVFISGVGTLAMMFLLPSNIAEAITAVQSGAVNIPAAGMDTELLGIMSVVTDSSFLLKIFGFMIVFVIGGFLLYASMFAAVGSSVDNIQDTQNLQQIVLMPIILSMVAMFVVFQEPNSTVAVVLSIIPFTSPVVMMARIPFGIPTWEIITSITVLYASVVSMMWLSGKIFRVGVFMYGKKPTIKELYRWIKYKY